MNKRLTTLAACLIAAGTALSAQQAVKSDYNGDGKSDVMFFNKVDTSIYELEIFNSSILAQGMVHVPGSFNWVVAASGVNPSTGGSDLFWQNKVTGQVYKMAMNGLSPVAASSKVVYTDLNADWQLIMAADFNRDGQADLLFRNVQNGQLWLQPLNPDGSLQAGSLLYTEPNLDWRPVSVIANAITPNENDLVWYNDKTGEVFLLQVNADGTQNVAGSKLIYTASSPDWTLVSADDYNRDGKPDLLFWNKKTGDVYVLLMDVNYNPLPASRTIWNADPTQWQIAATGDYNGDGYTDILWRNVGSGAGANGLYEMFLNVDADGNPQVNTTDSNLIYTASSSAWSPVGGLNSVSIGAPTADSTNYAALANGSTAPNFDPTDNTDLYSYKLVNPSVIKPGNYPVLYVSVGDPLSFKTQVQGPVIDSSVSYKVFSADNATDLTKTLLGTVLDKHDQSYLELVSPKAQNLVVLAQSNGDPSKVSARYVSVVANPGVTTLAASPTTINPGQSSTLSYTLTDGNTGLLTNDIDPTFRQVLSSASGTVSVSPAATTHYTLQATNAAGKTSSSSTSVTVNAQATPLDCTVNILGAQTTGGTTYVTAGGVYIVQVPAAAGVTYTWAVTGANIVSGQGTNQISVVIGPSGSTPTFSITKTLNGAYNTGIASATAVAAPTTPKAITVIEKDTGTTETTYLTAGKTIIAKVTPVAGMTHTWTISGATPTTSTTADQVTMTVGASGTVSFSVVETNAANTSAAAAVTTRTIVADPTNTKITSTGFVTPGVAGNGSATVPSAGPAAKYQWAIDASQSGGGTAAAVSGSDKTPALSYTLTGGTAGSYVNLTCKITNGAGDSYTTAPAAQQQIAAAPVTPVSISYSAPVTNNIGYVSVGSTSTATVTPGAGQQGSAAYNTMTYTWTVTNATIVSGQGTKSITYTPTATGPVTFSVAEVNPAKFASAAYTDVTTTIEAVTKPTITSFVNTTPITTAGTADKLTFAFSNGVGAIVDSGVALGAAPSVTGISSNTTTLNFNGMFANDPTKPHTLTLIVTNAAGDSVQATVSADVAAKPVINSFGAFTDSAGATAYTAGTALDFGTPLWLTPTYVVDGTNKTTAGQVVTITPGPINNPVSGTPTLILPAQGTTTYYLTVTNRAGLAVQRPVTTNVNTVAVTGSNQSLSLTSTLDLTTVFSVSGAVDTSYTLSILTDGTGGASIDSHSVLTPGGTAGTITVKAVSNADPTKSKTITVTVS